MKVKMTIEVEIENSFNFLDEEEKLWFENEVLVGDGTLMLHSNEIGDTVGVIKKVSNIQYDNTCTCIAFHMSDECYKLGCKKNRN